MLLLFASYIILLFGARTAAMGSAVVIPILLGIFAAVLREWRLKQVAVLLLVLFAVSLVAGNHFFYHDPNLVKKWDRQGESVAYRAENIFFSWKIATDHPCTGNRSAGSPRLRSWSITNPGTRMSPRRHLYNGRTA